MTPFLAAAAAAQTVWTVGPPPYTSVGAAVAVAADGDVIEVEPGTYVENVDLSDRVLTLRGTGGAAVTTLTAAVGTEVVRIVGGTVAMSGFTVAGAGRRGVVVAPSTLTLLPADVTLDGMVFDGASVAGGDPWAAAGSSLLADGCDVTVSGSAFGAAFPPAGWAGGHVGVRGGSVLFDGVTFQGAATRFGGPVYLESTDATFDACAFAGGSASFLYGTSAGGALYAWDSTLALADTTFDGAASAYVGGAVYAALGTVGVAGGTFVGNVATYAGGALYCDAVADCSVDGARFEGNTASLGGAVDLAAGSAGAIVRSTFVDNTATSGGAVFLQAAGETLLANDVFCGNVAEFDGGGAVYPYASGPATLRNNHFVENRALYWGSAVAVLGGVATSVDDLFARNHVTAGPTGYFEAAAIEVYRPVVYTTSGIDVRYALLYENTLDANVPIAGPTVALDPLLVDWVRGDCAGSNLWPAEGSPVVDAGDPALLDPDGSRADIGAFGGPDAGDAYWGDPDGDGTPNGRDCAPDDGTVGPALDEVCDGGGVDEDCDGLADTSDPDCPAPEATTRAPAEIPPTRSAAGCGCGSSAPAAGWVALVGLAGRRRARRGG